MVPTEPTRPTDPLTGEGGGGELHVRRVSTGVSVSSTENGYLLPTRIGSHILIVERGGSWRSVREVFGMLHQKTIKNIKSEESG